MIQGASLFVTICLGLVSFGYASTDFTAYADLPRQMNSTVKYVVKCVPQVGARDMSMNVIVKQNVASRQFQLVVARSFLGHSSVEMHPVRYIAPGVDRLGAPAIYQGQDAQLTISWTSEPNPNGFPGKLQTHDSTTALRCKSYTQFER